MKKHVWLTGACVVLLSVSAIAADMSTPAPGKGTPGAPGAQSGETREKWTPPKSRQEQIDRMEKRLDELKHMSDAEWNKHNEEMHQRFEQQRQQWKQMHSGGGRPGPNGGAGQSTPVPQGQ